MPSKVAPLNSMHPMAPSDAGPGMTHCEQSSSPCQNNALCSFIDAAMNICSFDTTTTHTRYNHDMMMMSSKEARAHGGNDNNEWGQRYNHPAQQASNSTTSQRPIIASRFSSGGHSTSLFRRASSPNGGGGGSSSSISNAEEMTTVILPHLRFNTFPSSSSSLQDFYALFLSDGAPHSFQLFHESYGDENVVITPWTKTQKKIKKETNNNTMRCENDDDEDEEVWNGLGEASQQQRTITYQTKISPGTSSNPLVSPSTTVSATANATTATTSTLLSSSNTIIPLGVTIVQTLTKNSNTTWELHCEFSFDFQNSSSPPTSSSSSIASNGSSSGGSSVGKKLLLGSTVGLSQYFMSHVVKGSTVNVSIFMTECNDGDAGAAINHHGAFGTTATTTTTTTRQSHLSNTQKSFQEDIFSCFSHPLLLPPDGLCGSTDRCTSSWRRNTSDNNSILCTEEPSKVGASLLSAIKAKNSSSATDFLGSSSKNKNKTVADVSLAMTPVVVARSNSDGCEEMPSSSDPNNSVKRRGSFQRKGRGGQEQDMDVLAYCSSRGYMKVKNIPSELSRAPSTISMRRMILDKSESTTTTTAAAGTAVSPFRSHSNQRISWNNTESGTNSGRSSAVETHGGIATSSSSATFRRGMSMRIQMELVDTSNNSNTACPTPSPLPFSRSPSIPSTIDDKIRRGLKKRFARSWVTWAESWCMRVWEEEEAERIRKKALGVAIPPIDSSSGTKRNKVNVRPSVRRIGDPKCPQPSVKEDNTTATTTTTSSTSSSPVSSRDMSWKEMHVRRSPTRKNERWMSMEQEDECGVEVECTVAIPQQHNQQKQKRRLKAVDINQNTEQESTKAATKRTGLLKHRRPKIK